jgi:hypothetical protein
MYPALSDYKKWFLRETMRCYMSAVTPRKQKERDR